MSQQDTPREFWIVKKFKDKKYSIEVFENKPGWESVGLGNERIHLVDYSQTKAQLKAKDEVIQGLLEALSSIAAINVMPENLRESMGEYSTQELIECCVTDTELARQALKDFEEKMK